jgi:transcriptional regulator with XRE-family HTH domain
MQRRNSGTWPSLRPQQHQKRNFTQAELSERVELAGSQINKLETNVSQPTLATALAIADALGVSIGEFLPQARRGRGQRKVRPPSG